MRKTLQNLQMIIPACVIAFAASILWGCSPEIIGSGDDSTVNVSFSVSMESELHTRAIGNVLNVNEIVVAVYEKESNIMEERCRKTFPRTDVETNGVQLDLVKGRTYHIAFWAQASENNAYTLENNGSVSVNYEAYQNGGFGKMEVLDAFYAVTKITVGVQNRNTGIVLKRPLVQLNFADKETQPVIGIHKAIVSFYDIPTSLNLFTGEVDRTDNLFFVFEDFPTETLNIDGVTYYYVASNYLLAPRKGASLSATLDIRNASDDSPIKTLEFNTAKNPIPLEQNKRTNILGNLVKAPGLWDGVIPEESPITVDEQNRYIIDEAADIAWLSIDDNSSVLNPNTFAFTIDVDMDNHEFSSLNLPAGSVIEGNGHTIRNLKMKAGLFGDATNLTLNNLAVENVVIEAEHTHVGVLANTLKGSSEFTNLSVSNASVNTSNGAAGGIVGKIQRIDEENRKEELKVQFVNCDLSDVTVNGTRANGSFVGLFNGYDKGESVSFDDACSSNSSQILNSYYSEGNESEWLEDNDYSNYNSWIGDEEYCRGTILFDGMQFIPKWDGNRKIEPIKIEDSDTNKDYYIYSATDLAFLQGETPNKLVFKEDIDLGGVRRENEQQDNTTGTNPFTPISRVKYLDGEHHTLYNLYVETDGMGGFISGASGQSSHKSLTFENPSIIVHYVTLDNKEDRGYAGTLVPVVWNGNTYSATDIKVNNAFIFGLGKIGGLIGFIDGETKMAEIRNCSVYGTTVKNKEGKTQELFEKEITMNFPFIGEITAKVSTSFLAQGEAGGLIGMIMGNSTISDCKVSNSKMDCYGEEDKDVDVKVGNLDFGTVHIQGRHVNNFIGNIRTPGGQTITITGCSVSDNEYVQTDGKRKDDPFQKSSSVSTHLVGKPYYLHHTLKNFDTKGSVMIEGVEFL